MIGQLFLLAVLLPMAYAAAVDLRTREVPDWPALSIAAVGLLYHLAQSVTGTVAVDAALAAAAGALLLGWVFVFRLLPADARTVMEQRSRIGVPPWFPLALLCFTTAAILALHTAQVVGVTPVVASMLVGTVFFLTGWGMYLAGMWGGADALMLAAVGYAVPAFPAGVAPAYPSMWPFPVTLFMTVLLVGGGFSVLYAAVTVCWNDAVRRELRALIRRSHHAVAAVSLGYGAAVVAATFVLPVNNAQFAVYAVAAYLLAAGLYALILVLRVVEETGMRRTVPVNRVVAGDVLAESLELETAGKVAPGPVESLLAGAGRRLAAVAGVTVDREPKIVGLTEEQVEEVRDRFEEVTVKTGVPFIVAFPAAVILLATMGDPVAWVVTALLP